MTEMQWPRRDRERWLEPHGWFLPRDDPEAERAVYEAMRLEAARRMHREAKAKRGTWLGKLLRRMFK